MIVEKLRYLASNVQISDFKPADSYIEVYRILKNRLNKIGEEFEILKNEKLKNTLKIFKNNGVEIIITD